MESYILNSLFENIDLSFDENSLFLTLLTLFETPLI